MARLPGHGYMNATTMKGTRTPVEARHRFVIEVHYSRPLEDFDGKKTQLIGQELRIPITIASVSSSVTIHGGERLELMDYSHMRGIQCWCTSSSVLVPTYASIVQSTTTTTEGDESTPFAQQSSKVTNPTLKCLCRGTKAQLFEECIGEAEAYKLWTSAAFNPGPVSGHGVATPKWERT